MKPPTKTFAWESGDAYERYMGRWSRVVARSFVEWLSLPPGRAWLDIGCGSGALSEVIADHCRPASLTAVDPSEAFVRTVRERLGPRARCGVGDAQSLPLADASVGVTVSGLVLNFIPKPEIAIDEMRRVTGAGGTVAGYIWDYAGKMDFLRHFWDTAGRMSAEAVRLHEASRFPDAGVDSVKRLFENAGLVDIETSPIDIAMDFQDFDDYWKPLLSGQGPAPGFVQSLDDGEKDKLRNALKEGLSFLPNGAISMAARAWAAKGRVSP